MIKNIIIFVAVAIAFVLVYIFFIKPEPEQGNLVSTGTSTETAQDNNLNQPTRIDTEDFLSVLLSVKSIKLDDSIFSDVAFTTLNDSNVVLTPDGTEGRPNPFAPVGSDFTGTSATPAPTTTTPPKPATTPTQTPQTQGGPIVN